MPQGDGIERAEQGGAGTQGKPASPRWLLWVAGIALIAAGIALFCYALLSRGFLDAIFYVVVMAMGVYLLLIPLRNRRAERKEQSSGRG